MALVLSNDLLIDRPVDVLFFYNQVDELLQFWVRHVFYFSEVVGIRMSRLRIESSSPKLPYHWSIFICDSLDRDDK